MTSKPPAANSRRSEFVGRSAMRGVARCSLREFELPVGSPNAADRRGRWRAPKPPHEDRPPVPGALPHSDRRVPLLLPEAGQSPHFPVHVAKNEALFASLNALNHAHILPIFLLTSAVVTFARRITVQRGPPHGHRLEPPQPAGGESRYFRASDNCFNSATHHTTSSLCLFHESFNCFSHSSAKQSYFSAMASTTFPLISM